MGVSFGATELDARAPRALELMRDAGVGWVRAHFYWGRIEAQPGQQQWEPFDALVARARAEGLSVLGVLAFNTRWNSTAPPSVVRIAEREMYPPADEGAWERYVSSVVERYKSDVHDWEVWNEPDLRFFWRGTPAQYARLLASAHDAVKRADPSARVLFGGLALSGGGDGWVRDFFADVLADPTYPGARSFDVASFHHYGSRGEARRRMDYVRQQLTRVGAGEREVWITEVGAPSDSALQQEAAYRGPDGQARWLREMLPFLVRDLGAARVFWYTLWDDPGGGRQFSSHGLLAADLTPKPAHAALRDLLARLQGAASGFTGNSQPRPTVHS